ncbi:MAG: Stp1/IreP family PP2C-type Ser/Thr phosphatase, partial [Actinomycetota bacterium]
MRVAVGVATDIGRIRERNEDSYLVEPPLYAVADGMGGARGGAVASSMALDKVEELFHRGKGPLGELIRSANRAVFERSVSDRNVSGMGTTLTAATVDEQGAHLGHVGDSRAYLLRAGSLRQLTDDHTLVNRMVKAGEITEQEAGVHPHRNVLTRSVGTEPEVDVDEEDVPLIDGDRLLLCSDGLTGMVTEPQIQAILEATPDPQDAADHLVKAANRAGGIDNITVVILDIHENADDSTDAERRAVPTGDPTLRSGTPKGRAPQTEGRRWRRPTTATIKKWAVRVGIVMLATLAVVFAIRIYLDRQWYVGEADGNVAVYQGIPARFGGLRFSHVELETDIPASEVAQLPQYPALTDGITANDRTEAMGIVEQIRRDLTTAAT